MKRGQQRQQERIGLVTKVARLLLCAGLLAPVYGAEDLRALAGGADQEIGAGETRVYELAVERGQFVEVVLDQKGGNGVDLAIAGPDNQQIAECDIPNGGTGPQVVAIIATAGGTHRVRIRYSELPSGDERLPVRFAVRSVIVRHPTAEDRTKAEAEIAYTRARQLQRQLSAESRRAAVEEYDRATALFESFGDTYRVGIIRNAVGLVQARLGSMRPALQHFERAAAIFHQLGDAVREGESWNNAGGANDVLGFLDQARKDYEKALALVRGGGNRSGEARVLSNIGKILADQAKFEEALTYYQQALQIQQALHNTRGAATVLGNIGHAYLQLGQFESARDDMLKAAELDGNTKDAITAVHLLNLGRVHQLLNRPAEAETYYRRSLDMYRAIGDRRGEGVALSTYGDAVLQAGEAAKATSILQQSVDLSRASGDRRREAAGLVSLANASLQLRQWDAAHDQARRALEGFGAVGDTNGEAKALLALGSAARAQGRLAEARDFGARALEKDEVSRGGAGAEQTRASYFASRQDDYQFMVDVLMELHARDPGQGWAAEALSTSERARARSLVDLLTESHAAITEGVDPALLARQQSIAETLNAKGARLLAAAPASARAEELRSELRDLERQYQEAQVAIRRGSPRYAQLTQPQPLTARRIQREILDDDSVLLEYALGAERSVMWAVSKDRLEAYLLPGRQVIEDEVAAVYEALTARGAAPRLETRAEAARRIAEADQRLAAAAATLSNSILGPARGMLAGKRLVIVPDGALQRLPFSMLPEPGAAQEPLVVAHEIVVLPSATALEALRAQTEGRAPAPKNLAVFADPVFDRGEQRRERSGDETGPVLLAAAANSRVLEHLSNAISTAGEGPRIPRLPYTAREAAEILRISPGGSAKNLRATGYHANRALATSGVLSGYRYVHFATHGFLDTERPSLSALVLSQYGEDKTPQDGFLRVSDIYNLKLSADLVVLSACQTGLGKEVRGEGLMGLTRAFMYAGAPRLIVSLWNVNDRATAELMAQLYRGLLRRGLSPAAALRQAQLELRKEKKWESPYYWAAFVQQGEWR